MNARSHSRRQGTWIPLLPIIALVLNLCVAFPAHAQGGLGVSGSFSGQNFEIPQGATVSAPGIYIVVFNTGAQDFQVRLTAQAPLGVNIILAEPDFSLEAGGQKSIPIAIEVTKEAAPGVHQIGVSVEPYRRDAHGIQIIGSAGQTAGLTVLGEGGRVTVNTVSPLGNPVPAVIRLLRNAGGKSNEFAYNETGSVTTTVAAGNYTAVAYAGGAKQAEEHFKVDAGEQKTVMLTVETVYFDSFGVVPSSQTKTGKLAAVQIVYSLKNLLKQVQNAKVLLRVTRDGEQLEQVVLTTVSPLEVGQVGSTYNYVPADGWANGKYGFGLELRLDGKFFAKTPEKFLSVSQPSAPAALAQTTPPSWILLGGLGTILVILAGLIVILVRRKGDPHISVD